MENDGESGHQTRHFLIQVDRVQQHLQCRPDQPG